MTAGNSAGIGRGEAYSDATINWLANRPLLKCDVVGICETLDLCWEYNDWVRCGPCALRAHQPQQTKD